MRQDKTRQDNTRQGKTRQEKTRQGKARQDNTPHHTRPDHSIDGTTEDRATQRQHNTRRSNLIHTDDKYFRLFFGDLDANKTLVTRVLQASPRGQNKVSETETTVQIKEKHTKSMMGMKCVGSVQQETKETKTKRE